MKIWLYRSRAQAEVGDLKSEHFIERYPDKAYVYTKLYLCYDKPDPVKYLDGKFSENERYIELPNYWYPEIKPEQFVELSDESLNK